MSRALYTVKAIPQTAWRRLRYTPGYIFLIWRWGTWLYACVWILARHAYLSENTPPLLNTATILLVVTLLQTLLVTLYAPILQILLPSLFGSIKGRVLGPRNKQIRTQQARRGSRLQGAPATDEEADIVLPLVPTRSSSWNIAIYGLDVLVCGLVIYFSGPFGGPPFGASSPFYRYGLSTILVASFTYRYRGGLLATLGYECFILLGAYFPPPGTVPFIPQVQDLAGALIDAPLVAILAAYLATLLERYTRSKRREQDNVRRQRALLHVSEALVAEAGDRKRLLQQSARQIRTGGHFEHLIIALVSNNTRNDDDKQTRIEIDTYVDSTLVETVSSNESRECIEEVGQTGNTLLTFEPQGAETGIARLYVPFFKDGQVYLILGAESTRQTPFEKKQEEFLSIVGAQLVVALENIRLTEQSAELAAAAERGRIAREIHDGVAQLVYMLSLNTETCAALAHRLTDETPEAETLAPLAERLDRLVTISKQALWETRHYMFTLKPLMSGTTTLTQMLTNQLHEFETISGLSVLLEVDGSETEANGDQRAALKKAQVGTAIFRITQEALSNAYKHAEATEVLVHLRHSLHKVEVEVRDNGKGLENAAHNAPLSATAGERFYSGHGLDGMRARATELGGTFEVEQHPGSGVCVRTCIPT